MDTSKLSGIVVYTIHENTALRNNLRKELKDKMKADELNESTYGVAIQGQLRSEIINKLQEICKKASEGLEQSYSPEDFVCLYWVTTVEETKNERYIKEIKIK